MNNKTNLHTMNTARATKREFQIYKEGITSERVTIVSKPNEPFDKGAKINKYLGLGYSVWGMDGEQITEVQPIADGVTVEWHRERYYILNSVRNQDGSYTYKIKGYVGGNEVTVHELEITDCSPLRKL